MFTIYNEWYLFTWENKHWDSHLTIYNEWYVYTSFFFFFYSSSSWLLLLWMNHFYIFFTFLPWSLGHFDWISFSPLTITLWFLASISTPSTPAITLTKLIYKQKAPSSYIDSWWWSSLYVPSNTQKHLSTCSPQPSSQRT